MTDSVNEKKKDLLTMLVDLFSNPEQAQKTIGIILSLIVLVALVLYIIFVFVGKLFGA